MTNYRNNYFLHFLHIKELGCVHIVKFLKYYSTVKIETKLKKNYVFRLNMDKTKLKFMTIFYNQHF